MKVHGFKGFVLIWLGQFVSIFGSALTRFAITIWIYQETGSATALSTTSFFAMAPTFLLMPIGGALADRWDRKKVMIASDLLGGISTVLLWGLLVLGRLELWQIYVASTLSAVAEAFQYPAFLAATAMLVPKEHFGRANGMRDLAFNASRIVAPLAAASLLAVVDISTIMTLDLASFGVAILTLLLVVIPQPTSSAEGRQAQTTFLKDVTYGFKFIWQRPSLLGLQTVFLAINLAYTMTGVLMPAMILSRTGNDEVVLGSLQSVMSIGALVGGVLISAWGGPKRKIHAVLVCQLLTPILGRVWFGLGYDLVSWLPAAFFLFFFIPISNGSTAAIWMAKTPPDVQGRVMATRRFAAQFLQPLAVLASGPLAEAFFEPAMMPGGSLASLLNGVMRTGPGAGISLMVILSGIVGLAVASLVYFIPAIWNLEDLLPDFIPDRSSHSPAKAVDSGQRESKEPAPARS